MKYKKLFGFFLCTFFSLNLVTKADTCDYAEQARLNSLAGTVRAEYQIDEKTKQEFDETIDEVVDKTYWDFYINIYNVTEDLSVRVEGPSVRKRYYSSEANEEGIIQIFLGELWDVEEYTIDVYPTNEACKSDAIRTINVTVPRLNQYAFDGNCSLYPDFYYCSKYTTLEEINYGSFYSRLEEYKEKLNQENEDKEKSITYKVSNFISNHKIFFIILALLIIIGTIGGTYIFKKVRKERKI